MPTFENLDWIDFDEQRRLFKVEDWFTPSKVSKLLGNRQLWDILSHVRQYPKIIIDLLWDEIDEDCIITDIDVDFNNNITFTFVEYFDIEEKEKISKITIDNEKIPEIRKRVETHKKIIWE